MSPSKAPMCRSSTPPISSRTSGRRVGRRTWPTSRRWKVPERLLERELDAALVLGAGAEDPALRLVDGHVVDAGLPAAHVAVVVELPQLVAVAAEPLAGGVVALVLEAHRDAV